MSNKERLELLAARHGLTFALVVHRDGQGYALFQKDGTAGSDPEGQPVRFVAYYAALHQALSLMGEDIKHYQAVQGGKVRPRMLGTVPVNMRLYMGEIDAWWGLL